MDLYGLTSFIPPIFAPAFGDVSFLRRVDLISGSSDIAGILYIAHDWTGCSLMWHQTFSCDVTKSPRYASTICETCFGKSFLLSVQPTFIQTRHWTMATCKSSHLSLNLVGATYKFRCAPGLYSCTFGFFIIVFKNCVFIHFYKHFSPQK